MFILVNLIMFSLQIIVVLCYFMFSCIYESIMKLRRNLQGDIFMVFQSERDFKKKKKASDVTILKIEILK